jgi:hypothetical protein
VLRPPQSARPARRGQLFVESAAVVLAAWGAVSAFAAILRLAVKPTSRDEPAEVPA